MWHHPLDLDWHKHANSSHLFLTNVQFEFSLSFRFFHTFKFSFQVQAFFFKENFLIQETKSLSLNNLWGMKTAINVNVLVDPGNTPLGLHLVFPICRLFMFRLQSFLYIPFHKKGTFSPRFVISTSSHVSFFFVLRHFPLLLRFLLISLSSSLEKILFVFSLRQIRTNFWPPRAQINPKQRQHYIFIVPA